MKKKSPPRINIGERYGRWEVLDVERVGNYYQGICQCDCGNTGSIRQDTLLNGQSSSCGCYSKEVAANRLRIDDRSSHRLYHVWQSMNRRCGNPKSKDYKYYGGRGITVCSEWHRDNPEGFWNFVDDMSNSFIEGLELDRIDNEGHYSVSNCKWSTRSEQVINSRTLDNKIGEVRWLNDGEETLHLAAMAKKYNLNPKLLQDRIGKMGLSLTDAINLPVKVKQYYLKFEGKCYRVKDVFTAPPNLYEVLKRENISLVDILYFLFGDNVEVSAKQNKELINLPNIHTLVSVDFKIPKINPPFLKYLLCDHKE